MSLPTPLSSADVVEVLDLYNSAREHPDDPDFDFPPMGSIRAVRGQVWYNDFRGRPMVVDRVTSGEVRLVDSSGSSSIFAAVGLGCLTRGSGLTPRFPSVASGQVWWINESVVQILSVDHSFGFARVSTLHGPAISIVAVHDSVRARKNRWRLDCLWAVYLGTADPNAKKRSLKVRGGDVVLLHGQKVEVVWVGTNAQGVCYSAIHDPGALGLRLVPQQLSIDRLCYRLPTSFRYLEQEVVQLDKEHNDLEPEEVEHVEEVEEPEENWSPSVFESFDEVIRDDDGYVTFRRGQKYAFTQEGLVHYRLTGLVTEDDTFVVVGVTEKGSVDRLGLSIEFDPSCLFVVRTIDIECTRDRRSIEPGTVVYVSEQEDLG